MRWGRVGGRVQREVDARRWERFSRNAGIETDGLIPADVLGVTGPGYEPLAAWQVLRAIRALRIARGRFTFVDLGAGKGRAALVAAWAGFSTVVGVEIVPELVAAATQNAERFRAHARRSVDISFVAADAGDYRFPDEPLVVFLFNPFDASILTRVIDNLDESLTARPRRAFLAYWNPQHAEVVDASACLALRAATPHFRIYASASAA